MDSFPSFDLSTLWDANGRYYTAADLLQSRWHIACIKGSDIGTVIPLVGISGELCLGREHPCINDPTISRHHARLRWNSHKLTLDGCSATNGTYIQRHYRTISAVQRSLSCNVADRLVLGNTTWEIRERPRTVLLPPSPSWSPKRLLAPRSVLTALSFIFVPLSFLRLGAFFGWWFLAAFAMAIIILIVVQWRKNHKATLPYDAATLLMHLSHCETHKRISQTHAKDAPAWPQCPNLDLWADQSDEGDTPGFFGSTALLHAFWVIAAQSRRFGGCRIITTEGTLTCGSGTRIVHLVQGASCHLCSNSIDPAIAHVGVAPSRANLPTWCNQLIEVPSAPHVCAQWVRQIYTVLDTGTERDIPPDFLTIEELWQASPPLPTQEARSHLIAPIGCASHAHPICLDLVDDGPHGVIVGTTGSGKSEALITYLLGLSRQYSPHDLRLILIDYKGGTSLGPLSRLPHTECLLSDIAPSHTTRAFQGIRTLFAKREAALAASPYVSVSQWQLCDPSTAPSRIVIACDEFTTFAHIHPDLFDDTLRLAAQGRALGIHIIFATQRPDKALSPALLANADLRIVLRCRDAMASRSLLNSEDACLLPPIAGRAIIDGIGKVQCAWAKSTSEVIKSITSMWPDSFGDPLWVAPLPNELACSDLPSPLPRNGIPIGLADGIEHGKHLPIVWKKGNIRFEGGESQRSELFSAALTTALHLSSSIHAPLISCNADEATSSNNIDLSEPARLIQYLAHGHTLGKHIFLIHDLARCEATIESSIGALHGAQLWKDFLHRAQHYDITLIATSPGVNTYWDSHAHSFTLRFLRSLNSLDATQYGLKKDDITQATPHRYLLTTAPMHSDPDVPLLTLPHPVQLLTPADTNRADVHTLSLPGNAYEGDENFWHHRQADCLVITRKEKEDLPYALRDLPQLHPKDWMNIHSLMPCEIILTTLTEELRRILIPLCSDSDWVLRLKRIPPTHAIWIRAHQAFLIRLRDDKSRTSPQKTLQKQFS